MNKVFVLYGGPLYIRFYITASVNTTVPNVYSTGIVSVNFDFIPLTADDVVVSGGLSPISCSFGNIDVIKTVAEV